MNPLAWLIGLLLPACGATGAAGLPRPALMDLTHLERPATPNTALAAPADFAPSPDIITRQYSVAGPFLFAAIKDVAARQQRTYSTAEYAAELQAHWVVRSAVFNFPDLFTAQIEPRGAHLSALILYSRSLYGRSDFGVNRQRLVSWLRDLDGLLSSSPQK